MTEQQAIAFAPLLRPAHYFLAVGKGDAEWSLVAFDQALLDAGVGDVNLVRLSSIVGPQCQRVEPIAPPVGSLVAVAYTSLTCDKPGHVLASAVAVAHPTDHSRAAIVMEHSALAAKEDVEEQVILMARAALEARGLQAGKIESVAVEHVVQKVGATFAGVVEF